MAVKKQAKNTVKVDKLARYSEVVDRAQLDSIQLLNLSFEIKPEFFEEDAENELGYDVSLDECHYEADAGIAMAFVICQVNAKNQDLPTLQCLAHYSVTYSIEGPCDVEATEAFLRKVAVFACYPYFRSLFASLDWSAGTRLPPLPVHKERVIQGRIGKTQKSVAEGVAD